MGDMWGDIGAILNAPFRAGATALDNAAAVTGYVATFIRYMVYIVIIVVAIVVLFYIIKSLVDVKRRMDDKDYALKRAQSEAGVIQEAFVSPLVQTVPVAVGAGKGVVETATGAVGSLAGTGASVAGTAAKAAV